MDCYISNSKLPESARKLQSGLKEDHNVKHEAHKIEIY